ncbi:MAG TPA: copper resistance protein [Campylobacterales bacterium]|nr:copper resistance protein [Campylobacterales bacterium]
MKKLLQLLSVMTISLFFVACGGGEAESQGFTKSGKAGSLDITYSAEKPLVVGDNIMKVSITENGKPLTGAKVEMKVFMPEMPGMPYMDYIKVLDADGDAYSGSINYSMGGTWQVRIFVEKDGKNYKHSSSVIL